MTFGNAVKQLNEECAHPCGFHLAMIDISLFPEEFVNSNTAHDLIEQTFDWRWNEPDKKQYSVVLSAEDMRYIGKAIEVYQKGLSELYIEPAIEKLVNSMGGAFGVNQ